jgi:flagellar M-ring protein FliF
VAVTAELDHSRDERTEDLYDKDRTALRSESRSEDTSATGDATTGGVAGARGNLPGAPAPAAGAASGAGSRRVSETRNFEVSHVVRKVVGAKGRVKRLSVAVVVDHLPGVDGKPGAPRSAEELARIAALVKTAAGIDADRGDRVEVQTAAFAREQAPAMDDTAAQRPIWARPPIAIGAAAALLVLLAASAAVLVMRRRRRAKEADGATLLPTLPASLRQIEDALAQGALKGEGAAGELAGAQALPAPGLPASGSPRDRAQLAARRDVAQAARLLAAWLAEDSATTSAAATGAAVAAASAAASGKQKEVGA